MRKNAGGQTVKLCHGEHLNRLRLTLDIGGPWIVKTNGGWNLSEVQLSGTFAHRTLHPDCVAAILREQCF